jgi:thioredoxin 1
MTASLPASSLPFTAVYLPDADACDIASRLASGEALLVACLCAEWCGTCREYLPRFTELAAAWPQHVFVWVDVETHPELLDDDDIEDFPTLLIQSASATRFYGPMLPHIGHLDRLLQAIAADPNGADVAPAAPGMRRSLASATQD